MYPFTSIHILVGSDLKVQEEELKCEIKYHATFKKSLTHSKKRALGVLGFFLIFLFYV